jgi:hypothetical protein
MSRIETTPLLAVPGQHIVMLTSSFGKPHQVQVTVTCLLTGDTLAQGYPELMSIKKHPYKDVYCAMYRPYSEVYDGFFMPPSIISTYHKDCIPYEETVTHQWKYYDIPVVDKYP